MDGSVLGEIEDETFNAWGALFKIQGINVHPGYAKGKMVNAVRVAADIVSRLPFDMSPETTEKREGYLHPHGVSGGTDQAEVKVLIRDFADWLKKNRPFPAIQKRGKSERKCMHADLKSLGAARLLRYLTVPQADRYVQEHGRILYRKHPDWYESRQRVRRVLTTYFRGEHGWT